MCPLNCADSYASYLSMDANREEREPLAGGSGTNEAGNPGASDSAAVAPTKEERWMDDNIVGLIWTWHERFSGV